MKVCVKAHVMYTVYTTVLACISLFFTGIEVHNNADTLKQHAMSVDSSNTMITATQKHHQSDLEQQREVEILIEKRNYFKVTPICKPVASLKREG